MMRGYTVKGLVRSLLRAGYEPEELVRDGKVLPKAELHGMYREVRFREEERIFREHMAHVSMGRVVTFA